MAVRLESRANSALELIAWQLDDYAKLAGSQGLVVHELTFKESGDSTIVTAYISNFGVTSRKTLRPKGLGMVDHQFLFPNEEVEKLANMYIFIHSNLNLLGVCEPSDIDIKKLITDETKHFDQFSNIEPAIIGMSFKVSNGR